MGKFIVGYFIPTSVFCDDSIYDIRRQFLV
jgi:hypothetical protein